MRSKVCEVIDLQLNLFEPGNSCFNVAGTTSREVSYGDEDVRFQVYRPRLSRGQTPGSRYSTLGTIW